MSPECALMDQENWSSNPCRLSMIITAASKLRRSRMSCELNLCNKSQSHTTGAAGPMCTQQTIAPPHSCCGKSPVHTPGAVEDKLDSPAPCGVSNKPGQNGTVVPGSPPGFTGGQSLRQLADSPSLENETFTCCVGRDASSAQAVC